jgi:acetylornithine deacetylase/succinyl-diaminopimelate desuccinylase-like protein
MDVVPADASRWQYPPFEGRLVDARVHGRGALDNKATGIFHLQAFLALHVAGKPLSRDVVFMATADEEAGGRLGVGWLIKHRPEIFEGIGGVLNEGGSGALRDGKLSFGIELTQKLPLWLKITATGKPGHGAVPRDDSAPRRLVRALAKLEQIQFEPRAVPAATTYLRNIAKDATPPWDKRLLSLDELLASPTQMSELQIYDHRLYAQLINTCSLTRMQGSDKINVVPPRASAEVDCRLLPDAKPDEVLAKVRKALAAEGVSVETSLSFGPGSSSTDNFVYKALEKVLKGRYPDAPILPKLNAGFTDSHFFREKGIAAYGFSPVILNKKEISGVHGDNESISLDNLRLGTEVTLEIMQELVYQ